MFLNIGREMKEDKNYINNLRDHLIDTRGKYKYNLITVDILMIVLPVLGIYLLIGSDYCYGFYASHALGVSIMCSLFSHIIAVSENREEIEWTRSEIDVETDTIEKNPNKTKNPSFNKKACTVLDYASYILIWIGYVLLAPAFG